MFLHSSTAYLDQEGFDDIAHRWPRTSSPLKGRTVYLHSVDVTPQTNWASPAGSESVNGD